VIVHLPEVAILNDDHFFGGLGEIVKMYIVAGPEAMAHTSSRIWRPSTAVRRAAAGPPTVYFGHCYCYAVEYGTNLVAARSDRSTGQHPCWHRLLRT
jgi:hypothetical protein